MSKKIKVNSVHDKAIALCEGRPVEIMGHVVKLCKFDGPWNACNECEMDSICRMEMVDVCGECESITRKKCYLQLMM